MVKFIYGSNKDFNLNDGVKIEDKKIQRMIDECISRLESGKCRSTYQGTGDTMVFAFGLLDDDKHMYEICVYVCKNYELAEAWLDKNGDWEKMDWSKDYEKYEKEEKYQNYTREELIDMIEEYKKKEAIYYNPRREI